MNATTNAYGDRTTQVLALDATTIDASTESGESMRVLLAPWGVVESASGTFVVDRESAAAVLAAFDDQGVDLPVDYEHQTLGGTFSSPTGQAPAAGWIRRLEVVDGEGIYGHVSWTPAASDKLAAREYRYLSPVAIVRKADRKLLALHSAALTNKPAIVGMRPIVNRREPRPDASSETSRTYSLGATGGLSARVPETATVVALADELPVAPNAPHARTQEDTIMQEKLEALRGALDVDDTADVETVLVAATRRLNELTQSAARRDAEDLVAGAMRAGKLAEAQREWAVALAMKDRQAFEAWEASAPVIVTTGRTDPPDDDPAGDRTCQAVIAGARREYRNHPELELLTTEDAYVADAVRQAGM